MNNKWSIKYFEPEECRYCGTRDVGLSEHHIIRRSERPDLINDKRNKVWLCNIRCHHKAEHDHEFYKKIQRIFLTKEFLKEVSYKI